MVYSSLAFILFALVFIPLFYRADTNNAQTLMIFLGSCFFLSYSGVENLVVAAAVIATSYAAYCLRRAGYRVAVPLAITLLLSNLLLFKLLPVLKASWGITAPWPQPSQWAVPLGLSFYTFQIIGGMIEMEDGARIPVRRFTNFVMFFPHLIAGPICKARVLIPQLDGVKQFRWRNMRIGLHLFLLGYVKKTLIADPLGQAISGAWLHPEAYTATAVWLANIGFYLQVYADFSGYTDMGRGIARLLGFSLPINFRAPYLAASPLDFWQRWHISLTTWFRHYFYQPIALWLGRNIRDRRRRTLALTFAAFAVMAAIGLWHGVGMRFVLFGVFHGALLVSWLALPIPREPRGAARIYAIIGFQLILMLSFIIFRAPDIATMARFAAAMAGLSAGTHHINGGLIAIAAAAVFAMQTVDFWITRRQVAAIFAWQRASNLALCLVAVALIGLVGYKVVLLLAQENNRAMSDGFIYFDF